MTTGRHPGRASTAAVVSSRSASVCGTYGTLTIRPYQAAVTSWLRRLGVLLRYSITLSQDVSCVHLCERDAMTIVYYPSLVSVSTLLPEPLLRSATRRASSQSPSRPPPTSRGSKGPCRRRSCGRLRSAPKKTSPARSSARSCGYIATVRSIRGREEKQRSSLSRDGCWPDDVHSSRRSRQLVVRRAVLSSKTTINLLPRSCVAPSG